MTETIKRTYPQALDMILILRSEDGENPEYDRGQMELVRDLFGLGHDMESGLAIVKADLRLREVVRAS